ncbi:MAG: flagellar basal body rod protein FlgB [Proteobacteria bacterium]|jgi:flagellar basal-body rod protein FlgB|nr:flagellar basal body rod protein FlgB [Pseudomonadota bacterium]
MNVNDKTMQALSTSLKFREMRQELGTSNVANAQTPGYKATKLDFEEALSRALDVDGNLSMNTADDQHFNVGGGGFNNLEPEVYENPNGVVSENGNTVDVEAEMAQMAENKIMYDTTVQLINKKLGLMKYTLNNEK